MDARYKEPSHEQLTRAIVDLRTQSHSNRRDAINELYNLTSKTHDHKVIIGAALFHRETIALEYTLRSPTHSDLYNELTKDILMITPENPMNEKEKLVYLRYYYDAQKLEIKDGETQKAKSLDAAIQPVTDRLLKQTPDLKTALMPGPGLAALQEEVKNIPGLYQEKCKARFWNNDINHQKTMLFIQFLSTPEADALLLELSKCKDTSDEAFKQYKYTVYFGTLLYAMLQIEREYESYKMNPANSDLYKFCRKALKINHSNDVPDIIKLNFYVDYRSFLREVIANEFALSVLNKYVLKEASFSSKLWHLDRNKMDYFADAKAHLKSTANGLDDLIKSETFLWKCAKTAVDKVILTAAGVACFEVAVAGYSLGLGSGLLINLGNRIGQLIIRGPWGAYIGGAIAAKYEQTAIVGSLTAALMFAFQYLKDWAYGKNESPLDNCETAKKFRSELKAEIGYPQLCEEEAKQIFYNTEWYRAVTTLPSKKLTAEVKERIRETISSSSEADATQTKRMSVRST